jgi:hypothetical protein
MRAIERIEFITKVIWVIVLIGLPVYLLIYNFQQPKSLTTPGYYLLLGVFFVRGLYDLFFLLRDKKNNSSI